MKEFIDKLIERLEEESNNAEAEMHILADSEYSLPCQYDRIDIEECKSKTFCEAISIVNELAEEYNKRYEPTIDLINYGIDGYNMHLKEQYRKGYEDAKKENGWIPCSVQEEPTENGKYIVWVQHFENKDLYSVDFVYWLGEWKVSYDWNVIAWMPIAPYTKGE